MFKVKCSGCGAQYELDPELRGQVAQCACGKDIAIPAPEPIDDNQVYTAECIHEESAATANDAVQSAAQSDSGEANIEVFCANCKARYEVSPDMLGMRAECQSCGQPFIIAVPEEKRDPAIPEHFQAVCAKCGAVYDLTAEFAGMQVECPECKNIFIVEPPAAAENTPAPQNIPAETPPVDDGNTVEPEPEPQKPDVDDFADDRTVRLKRPKRNYTGPGYANHPPGSPVEHPAVPVPDTAPKQAANRAAPQVTPPAPEPEDMPESEDTPQEAADFADDRTVCMKRPKRAAYAGPGYANHPPGSPAARPAVPPPAAPAKPAVATTPKPGANQPPKTEEAPPVPWYCFWKKWFRKK